MLGLEFYSYKIIADYPFNYSFLSHSGSMVFVSFRDSFWSCDEFLRKGLISLHVYIKVYLLILFF